MENTKNEVFFHFLLKEYDYYMQRIGVCQDIAKSIIFRTIAMVAFIIVGAWQWTVSQKKPEFSNLIIGGAVLIFLISCIIAYAVFSMYLTWLDRKNCELKLNYIRNWFFRKADIDFNKSRYQKISKIRLKSDRKMFTRKRRPHEMGNPWFFQSMSLVLIGLAFIAMIVFIILGACY